MLAGSSTPFVLGAIATIIALGFLLSFAYRVGGESMKAAFAIGAKVCAVIVSILIAGAALWLLIAWTVSGVQALLPSKSYQFSINDSSIGSSSHSSIANWVLRCVGASAVNQVPANFRPIFQDPSPFLVLEDVDTSKLSQPRSLNVSEISLVQLSYSILSQRMALSNKATDSYLNLEYVQALTILIGLITTVVVSVSSTELFGKADTVWGKGLKFMAIFLPALGTAVAAINAFYNPRDDWNRASNTLANMAQLHSQMAVGIWAVDCIKDNDADSLKKVGDKVAEWTKRYGDIVAVADAGSSSGKGDAQGQTPSGAAAQPQSGGGAGK